MSLRPARNFQNLEIKKHPVRYSFWPTKKGERREILQSVLFSSEPWIVMDSALRASPLAPAQLDEARALIEQANDYYRAATTSTISAAKAVQLYYCYLNLVKCFLIFRGRIVTGDRAMHGLKERLSAGGVEFHDAFLQADPHAAGARNIFDLFLHEVSGTQLAAQTNYPLPKLIPQVVTGHRLWAAATEENERFLAIDEVILASSIAPKSAWVNLAFARSDLTRYGVHQKDIISKALGPQWRNVAAPARLHSSGCTLIEQVNTITYGQHPSQVVRQVCASAKPHLWTVVTSTPPYRRYYVYLCPPADAPAKLPQLLSMYAIAFYLGSITRYRPHHFDTITAPPYGAFIEACLTDVPTQFIYLMASEFAQQEVTRPAIAS